MTDTASERLLEVIQTEREDLERRIEIWKEAYDLCESPLEKEFYTAFVSRFTPDGAYINGKPFVFGEWRRPQGILDLRLFPQEWIEAEGHRYRADFVIEVWTSLRSLDCRKFLSLVVEIDGHEFHERTKEQAERDRSRDRRITRTGYQVLRFTGREVNRDPFVVVSEILSSISSGLDTMFQPSASPMPTSDLTTETVS